MAAQEAAAAELIPGPSPRRVLYWTPGLPYAAVAFALSLVAGAGEAVRDFWGKNAPGETGRVYFVGVDGSGREVYAAGLGSAGATASRAVHGIIAACCDEPPVLLRRCDLSGLRRRPGASTLEALAHAAWKAGFKGPALALLAGAAPPRTQVAERGEAVKPTNAAGRAGRRFVFYHCYGSAHSSVVTAAIHLGMLPADRTATVSEVVRLPWFDRVRHRDIGFPVHVGDDESGVGVYVLGLGPSRSCARRFVREVIEACGLGTRVSLVDCLPLASGLVRAGGFLSRRLGLVFPGRLMAAAGVCRRYWRFVSLAWRTRLRVGGPGCAVDARSRATP